MKTTNPYIIELAPTLSAHWYHVWRKEPEGTRGEFLGTFPSSTTILNAYPQSPQLTQWIADQGWSEAQRIKSDAGKAGTRVHDALESLLKGEHLVRGPFSLEEWYKISTFVKWHAEYQPEILALEMPVFSEKYGFAGRLDCIARIGGEIVLIDWKTSKSLYPHFPLQFASYAQAIEEMTDLIIENTAVFQMGASNKDGFRYKLYPDWHADFEVFRNVYATWRFDYGKRADDPPVLELPDSLKLEL